MDKLDLGPFEHCHFFVMLNGSSKGFFKSSCGLRLGDLLSLFLFTLVAYSFNGLISKALATSLIEGFRIGSEGFSISHLHFADDTICFMKNLGVGVAFKGYPLDH